LESEFVGYPIVIGAVVATLPRLWYYRRNSKESPSTDWAEQSAPPDLQSDNDQGGLLVLQR